MAQFDVYTNMNQNTKKSYPRHNNKQSGMFSIDTTNCCNQQKALRKACREF